MKAPLRDRLGQTFEYGDLVVYPDRRGSLLWMNAGWVEDWNTIAGTLTVRQRRENGATGRLSTLHRLDRVVRVGELRE